MSTSEQTAEPSLLPRGDEARLFLLVVCVALLVRALHLLSIHDAVFFHLYMGDAASYHRWALNLQAGNWLGDRVFYQAPLYPYFMGAVYTLIGNHPMVLRAVQALLGATACGLVAVGGGRLLGRRAGAVAGGLLALYAPAIFFDGLVQKTSLAFFLVSLLLLLLAEAVCRDVGARPGSRRRLWVGIGAVLGLLVLTRENTLALSVPLAAWALLGLDREGAGLARRLRDPAPWIRAATLVLGLATVLGPVALRNLAVSGEPHLTTSQFGPNFYMGNNPGTTGLPRPLRMGRDNPRFEQRDAVELAEQATGRELSPGEVSEYWTRRALGYITSRPLDWLALLGQKAALIWNDIEIADTEDLYTHAEASPVLRVLSPFFRFGTLAPLALLGVWITRRQIGRLWPFWLTPLVYLGTVLVFLVYARYRFPAIPFLTLFAGAGLARLASWLDRARWTEITAATAATVGAAVVSFWPLVSVEGMRSGTRMNIGAALERREGLDAAVEQYRRALALDPANATAHFYLATALQRQGRLEAALEHYRRAVVLQPSRSEIRNNLGVALVAAGRTEEAERAFRNAVEADPGYGQAWDNLGSLARNRGNLARAIELYRRAVDADPGLVPARIHLADLLIVQGRLDEAFEHYGAAAERGARDEALRHMVPTAWRMATHPDSAVRMPERSLQLARRAVALADPPGPAELRTLAAALARNGRFQEAVVTAEEAVAAARTGRGEDGEGRRKGPPRPPPVPTADAAAIRGDLERYRRGEAVVDAPDARRSPGVGSGPGRG